MNEVKLEELYERKISMEELEVLELEEFNQEKRRHWFPVNKKGMELVQVAILIAIAVGLGIIFKDKIGEFVNGTFTKLSGSGF